MIVKTSMHLVQSQVSKSIRSYFHFRNQGKSITEILVHAEQTVLHSLWTIDYGLKRSVSISDQKVRSIQSISYIGLKSKSLFNPIKFFSLSFHFFELIFQIVQTTSRMLNAQFQFTFYLKSSDRTKVKKSKTRLKKVTIVLSITKL